ncbi:MAG TPA: ATP-binding protein, partial [Opitutus sp.]|nr:ATP-binding protein [Opitutus sp.]
LIVENAREYAIFSTDLERRVTSWNVGAERLLGYTETEIVGQSADIIFTPEDRAKNAPEREAGTALRDGRAANERWHLRKNGTRFWGSGVVMAMQNRNGSILGLLKIMTDQTEARATAEALERSRSDLLAALQTAEQARAEAVAAGRAKDQFLAALSHELRTPLNPVMMIASEAAADPSLPAHVRADFEVVRKNVELEARLIDDMLDITRITQGKLALQAQQVDLHASVREAVAMLRTAASEKHIVVSFSLQAWHSQVLGDPARLQQIFANLLSNAIKFTPSGGTVVVESANDETLNEIVVRVTDTGIGLTRDELTRVFQPFTQGGHAGESGSALYGGLGLGLTIVEELSVRHGGRVSAASPGPGQGATFSVSLPIARSVTAPPPMKDTVPEQTNAVTGLRILLVEDHAPTRMALQRMLARRNHTVISANSCAAALEEVKQRSFDLVISDIGLPDGDGYELLGRLRETQPQLPGIALSGFGMEGDLRRSETAGFAVHLVKPVPMSKLDAAISQLGIGAPSVRG